MSDQNILITIADQVSRGVITSDEGNIQLVEKLRVRIVSSPLPKSVRTALNNAVKAGRIGKMSKQGLKPECYYHLKHRNLAITERKRIESFKKEQLNKHVRKWNK